jgi:hypothetical protein
MKDVQLLLLLLLLLGLLPEWYSYAHKQYINKLCQRCLILRHSDGLSLNARRGGVQNYGACECKHRETNDCLETKDFTSFHAIFNIRDSCWEHIDVTGKFSVHLSIIFPVCTQYVRNQNWIGAFCKWSHILLINALVCWVTLWRKYNFKTTSVAN